MTDAALTIAKFVFSFIASVFYGLIAAIVGYLDLLLSAAMLMLIFSPFAIGFSKIGDWIERKYGRGKRIDVRNFFMISLVYIWVGFWVGFLMLLAGLFVLALFGVRLW